MNSCERVWAVLDGKPVDHLPLMPITMMFAADRIGRSYGDYASDHHVLVEGQLHVAEEFGFDYVSCISDPAREAADCGAAVQYFPDQPPAIIEEQALLTDKSKLDALKMPDPLGGGRMTDRVRAAELFKQKVAGRFVIEGWIEGPCAMAADLRGINNLMLDFYDDPDFVRRLFAFVVEMEVRFAKAQIAAGAELMGIGDAAASLVGPEIYHEFVWPFEQELLKRVHALGARSRLHICGNMRANMADIGSVGCDIFDVDFLVPMDHARREAGPKVVLLGNLDPVRVIRNGTPALIRAELAECHHAAGARYIVGAGCEIPRGTPPENLLVLRDFARNPTA
ncbi:MAG: uroporphyrinogen decarboxylase family protein [Kiritimatiellaeota bacterium]|nr:uroporphyrinogen decarboxylase family protein [Kiritimatiellota bacterium]